MSSPVHKRATQTSCNVLLCTAFPSSTRSLRSDSSSTNTKRKSTSRTTGRRCFNNYGRSTCGNNENGHNNSNACSSNKHYIRNNCTNANDISRSRNNKASIRFMSTPCGRACGGRRRFFILLPLILLLSVRHHFCTAGGHYEAEDAALPATSSSPSQHEGRISPWRSRGSSTASVLSAPAAETTAASLSPASLQDGGHFHKPSPLDTGPESLVRAERPSLLERRKTSGARGSLRMGLLKRLNSKKKGKELTNSYYDSDSDSMTPPVFDSPSIEKEFFSIGIDPAEDFSAITPGCAGESRTSFSDTSEGYDSSSPTPDTPTSSGVSRRQNSVAFKRLVASFSPRTSRRNGNTTSVFVEGNEAGTADSRAQQQGDEGDHQEKLQQKEQQQEQQYEAAKNLTRFSSATKDAQVAIEPRPSPSHAGADGTKTDFSSENVPPYSAKAGVVIVKRRADLQHRLCFALSSLGDEFGWDTDDTPHPSASSGTPQTPAEISAANHKQTANSLGRQKGDEDALPVDPKKHVSRTALWETLRTAVADFHETTNLVKFALSHIEKACARQNSNIDEFVGHWVAKKTLPKTIMSDMLELVKDQGRIFVLARRADARCQRTKAALQRVNHLYKTLKRSSKRKRSISHRGAGTRDAATPAHGRGDVDPRKQAEAPADPDTAATGDDRVAAASEQFSSDDESGEEFSISPPTTPSAPISPSLASSEPNNIPQGGNNPSSISEGVCGMEEAEEEGALKEFGTTMYALQLEALSKSSHCVAVKEEAAYTFIRLLYWLKMIRAPELRKALLKEAAESAEEEALTSLRKESSEVLSPYIRRKALPPRAGQELPERARKVVDLVNFAASAIGKIFEGVRQRQLHLDVWLGYLVTGIAKDEHVLEEIQGLKMLQEEGRREIDNILSILQVQQLSWSWSVALVERQLQEQPLAFKSARSCESLWSAAKDLVITRAELYYLIRASEGLSRKLVAWKKYFLKVVQEQKLRKRAT